jgi:hypothetical protein
MPRARRVEPFWLVLVDDDKRAFTVVGPMSDDTQWNSRVCKAQEQKRRVNIYNTELRPLSREQIIADAQRNLGQRYQYVDEVFV